MKLNALSTFLGPLLTCLILITSTGNAHAKSAYNNLEKRTPNEILGLYLYAMEQRDSSPNLPIYTKDTQEWQKSWNVTNQQMANSAASLISCGEGKTITKGKLAVIRYRVSNRECNPFYLVKENGAWRLDFLTMMQTIRMNQNNLWHFSRTDHPYMFAFKDWRIDKNGFPH